MFILKLLGKIIAIPMFAYLQRFMDLLPDSLILLLWQE